MSDSVRPAVDFADLLARIGGNLPLVGKLFEAFEQSVPAWLHDLDTAIQANDAEKFRKAAHTAKGALSTLAAHPAAELARSLEELGKAGDLANARIGVAQFTAEMERVREAFRTKVAEIAKSDS